MATKKEKEAADKAAQEAAQQAQEDAALQMLLAASAKEPVDNRLIALFGDIDEAKALAEYNGIKFKLVKSSRLHESYRYGEWKDEMWDKLLFKPSDEYIGNWLGNDNKQ